MNQPDKEFMQLAIEQARQAEARNEVPVGAVLVIGNEVVAAGSNSPIAANDPTAHAEINTLRAAAVELHNYRLPGSTLYVTLEPCAMCAGALVHARVQRLVFGCADPRGGAAGSVFNIAQSVELNHRIDVTSGVLEHECRDLLQAFFRARRS